MEDSGDWGRGDRRGDGAVTFTGSDKEGGAHPQIMQMRRCFDAKQAGLAANVSPVVKGRDSLPEIPREREREKERGREREGGREGRSRGVLVMSGAGQHLP